MDRTVSKEQIYDQKIAPLVQRIIEICKSSDIAFDGFFELDGDLTVATSVPSKNESAGQRMRFYMAKAGNNLDAFIIAVARDKQLSSGHSSAVLQLIGVKP